MNKSLLGIALLLVLAGVIAFVLIRTAKETRPAPTTTRVYNYQHKSLVQPIPYTPPENFWKQEQKPAQPAKPLTGKTFPVYLPHPGFGNRPAYYEHQEDR